ncbi:hypothetical protein BDV30DRAFT_219336 [Aspergillus minisclerotigenes]|uniref:Uncharacterized protein n=1 Tax=Aspergillus minisclerotigenes TaxID=656917 RepID=A0A5N6INE8_9EURO|nr:hypothetical protein BDV30DRAFT_219336 [Aspergillus minisclerotigenes]
MSPNDYGKGRADAKGALKARLITSLVCFGGPSILQASVGTGPYRLYVSFCETPSPSWVRDLVTSG